MRLPVACGFALIALSCGSSDVTPTDAGADSTPTDSAAPDGGTPADAATDGAVPDAATDGNGGCPYALTGSSVYVLTTNQATTSSLIKVHPDGDVDEAYFDFRLQGKDILVDDFWVDGSNFIWALVGSKMFKTSLSNVAGGYLELGTAIPFTTSTGLSYLTRGPDPFLGVTTGIYLINPAQGTMKQVGVVGSACTFRRDFVSGSPGGNVVQTLARCNTDWNTILETTFGTDTDGGIVSSTVEKPSGWNVNDYLVGFPAPNVAIGAKGLYKNGALVRPLRRCLGSTVLPFSSPRSTQ